MSEPNKARPWEKYRPKPHDKGQDQLRWKLLQPGWGGCLDDGELHYIAQHLQQDEKLRLWWGIPSRWKSLPEEVIKRVAMDGSPDDQAHNRRLARPRQQSRLAA